MVENYFRSLEIKSLDEKLHPKVKKLIGRITLPADFDIKKAKDEYIKEKYGL
jgi:hypothetical protein